MTDAKRVRAEQWTSQKALAVSVFCLIVGIAGGWLIRGAQAGASSGSLAAKAATAPDGCAKCQFAAADSRSNEANGRRTSSAGSGKTEDEPQQS